MQNQPIKIGGKSFIITDARWDSASQTGIIKFEDDNGIEYETISLGMFPCEQRQAVVDDWMDRLRKACGNYDD